MLDDRYCGQPVERVSRVYSLFGHRILLPSNRFVCLLFRTLLATKYHAHLSPFEMLEKIKFERRRKLYEILIPEIKIIFKVAASVF
jgi:hypothetical protein